MRRLAGLAVPPAWTDVWINPNPRGHLQATGRDARRRKQFRYHPRWTAERDADKFSHLVGFCRVLPRIRRRVAKDLREPGLSQEKVVAAIVRLLEATFIRIGNEEYASQNGSFGLTTLRSRHAIVRGSTIRLSFRGKGGKEVEAEVTDPRVARVVKRCQELPGQVLFGYVDENGERRTVSSEDVNDYLRESAGADYTAKDFRTWGGTVLAAVSLRAPSRASSRRPRPSAMWLSRSTGWPDAWATRERCRAAATCTPPSSIRTWTTSSPRRSRDAPIADGRVRPRDHLWRRLS